jgi:hypothetical protein
MDRKYHPVGDMKAHTHAAVQMMTIGDMKQNAKATAQMMIDSPIMWIYNCVCAIALLCSIVIFCVGCTKAVDVTAHHMAYTFTESYSQPPPLIGWSADGMNVGALAEKSSLMCLKKTSSFLNNTINCPPNDACTLSTFKHVCEEPVYGCSQDQASLVNCLHQTILARDSMEISSQIWFCVSHYFEPISHEKDLYDACFRARDWAVSEVLQNTNSNVFLGSYNSFVLIFIGLWIQCCIGVYCVTLQDGYTVTNWKKANTVDTLVVLVMSLVFTAVCPFIALLVIFFKDTGEPMDNYTMGLCMVSTTLAVMYVLSEIVEVYWRGSSARVAPFPNQNDIQPHATADIVMYGTARNMSVRRQYTPLAYNMYTNEKTDKSKRHDFTPIHVTAWADVRAFTECLMVIGVMGVYKAHLTHEVNNVFLGFLYTSVVHACFVRCMISAYIDHAPGDKDHATDKFALRVVSSMTMAASVIFFAVGAYNISNTWTQDDPPKSVGIQDAQLIHAVVIFTMIVKFVWAVVLLVLEFGSQVREDVVFIIHTVAEYEYVCNLIFYVTLFGCALANTDTIHNQYQGFQSDYNSMWNTSTAYLLI